VCLLVLLKAGRSIRSLLFKKWFGKTSLPSSLLHQAKGMTEIPKQEMGNELTQDNSQSGEVKEKCTEEKEVRLNMLLTYTDYIGRSPMATLY